MREGSWGTADGPRSARLPLPVDTAADLLRHCRSQDPTIPEVVRRNESAWRGPDEVRDGLRRVHPQGGNSPRKVAPPVILADVTHATSNVETRSRLPQAGHHVRLRKGAGTRSDPVSTFTDRVVVVVVTHPEAEGMGKKVSGARTPYSTAWRNAGKTLPTLPSR
jgi:hypothetical protein